MTSDDDLSGQQAVRRAYDEVAATYGALLPDTRAESPLDLAMVDEFARRVTAGADPLTLDGGCGAGRMSRYLADRGCRVVGADLSPGMVAEAHLAHPDLGVLAGSLTDLPFADDLFEGVLLWYSIIHTPPQGQSRLVEEAVRVLRPGGHLLVAFQTGRGRRDVSPAYRRHGHEVVLERHLHTPDEVAGRLAAAGLSVLARMERAPVGAERDGQAVLLARAS